MAEVSEKVKKSKVNVTFTIIIVVLLIIIVPILSLTITLLVKSVANPDYPPSIFGYAPLTVASGSMSGENADSFDEGDLIFIKILDDEGKNDLKEKDVICYQTDGIFVTHRIISVLHDADGNITQIITMGDANYSSDDPITLENVYGIYAGKIANLGDFAEFLQTPVGIVVFIGVPIAAFVLFEAARMVFTKKKSDDAAELQSKTDELLSKDEEIARLKAQLAEKDNDNKE